MNQLKYDVVVIGAGPAGMAAAIKAQENGASVALLERSSELGGILNQCIHSGFGLQYFKEELTGPEYAQRFAEQVAEKNIDVYLDTMVLDIDRKRNIQAINRDGILEICAGAVVLAMGCRERTRGAVHIPGDRPAGVFTAGLAQRYVNIENQKPGTRAVILGSGDIGLIMARRLTLEGIEVAGVYELMPYANGLYRNIKNCLDDFGIPLHLSTTVTRINGHGRVTSIETSKVDENLKPIPGTEEVIPCDTLLLSIGLIPENELSLKAGVTLNPVTNGASVDSRLQTDVPGIFACGNVLHVHDLVDNVSIEAEQAGIEAAAFAAGNSFTDSGELEVRPGGNVRYTVPSRIEPDLPVTMKFRSMKPVENGRIQIKSGDREVYTSKRSQKIVPSIMQTVRLKPSMLGSCTEPLTVSIVEEEE